MQNRREFLANAMLAGSAMATAGGCASLGGAGLCSRDLKVEK